MPGYARICQDMPGYARICQDMPGYARIAIWERSGMDLGDRFGRSLLEGKISDYNRDATKSVNFLASLGNVWDSDLGAI